MSNLVISRLFYSAGGGYIYITNPWAIIYGDILKRKYSIKASKLSREVYKLDIAGMICKLIADGQPTGVW